MESERDVETGNGVGNSDTESGGVTEREKEGEMGEGGRGESEMKPKIAQLLAEKFSIC